MPILQHSEIEFNCVDEGEGTSECPECSGVDLTLVLLCCPSPTNLDCNLSCDTPVLVKACNGTPPYYIESDDSYLSVTMIAPDLALVSIRKAFVQWGYRLRYKNAFVSPSKCSAPTLYSNPDAYVLNIEIQRRHLVYDCDMNLIDPNLDQDFSNDSLWDAQLVRCDNDCIGLLEPHCINPDLGFPLNNSFGTIAFIRGDVTEIGRVYNAHGLDVPVTLDGAQHPVDAPSITEDHLTGVFHRIPIPLAPQNVTVYDALDNSYTLPIVIE